MKKKCGLNHAMQEGLLLLLLGGWLLWYSVDAHQHSYIKDWAQSPSLFPVIVSCLLGLFGAVIFSQGLKEQGGTKAKGGNALRVLILLGMSLAYYAALSVIELPYMALTIGSLTLALSVFELATVVFLAAMMVFLGVRNKAVLVLVPVGASAFLSVMFRTLLRVLLP
ncbi:MAG: tripartite tricarboxylate transporter TctB family protein [Clostridia bacterium]|nr:tripartite tricarboxylate transporter TctB family protein [Clostridia bacterium]